MVNDSGPLSVCVWLSMQNNAMASFSSVSSSSQSVNSFVSSLLSWYFSDNSGQDTSIGSSVCNDLEGQIQDLQNLKQELINERHQRSMILQKIWAAKSNFDQERLEAEHTLLLSSLKTHLLLAKFRKKCEPQDDNVLTIGAVTISKMMLQFVPSHPKLVAHQYFVCALETSNCELLLSQIVELNSNNVANFKINHTFRKMVPDFEIKVKIFVLTIYKKPRFAKFLCHRKSEDEDWGRESLFTLWKETIITIDNINESNEIILDLVHSKLCKLFVDVAVEIDADDVRYAGWVDVSHNGLFWNQKWCVLRGTHLSYYNYPNEPRARKSGTDLQFCDYVKICESSRRHTLVLESPNIMSNQNYLSVRCSQEFHQWKNYLVGLIGTIKLWKQNVVEN